MSTIITNRTPAPTVRSLRAKKIFRRAKKTTATKWKAEQQWVLTFNQMYGRPDVYVHSTVRNFYKNMRVTGFFQQAMGSLQRIADKATKTLDDIALHVKPDESLRTPTFFSMFKSAQRELDINALKNLILQAQKNDVYKNAQKMTVMEKSRERKTDQKSKGQQEFLSITPAGKITYILNEKKAVENIKEYFLKQLVEVNASMKVMEQLLEAIGEEVVDINFDTISSILGTEGAFANSMTINGKPVSLNSAFQAVQSIVKSIGHHVPLGGDDEKKYKAIAEVGNFLDFVNYKSYAGTGKKGNYWSDLGSVFEAIIAAGIRELGETVNLVGADKDLQEYNTTDIEILTKEVLSAVDGSKHALGVSIKQTINFNKEKTINEVNYNKIYNVLGVNPKYGEKIIKQYKYFMLNYSLLADFEIEDKKNAGLRALSYTDTLSKHQKKEDKRAAAKNEKAKTIEKKDVARVDDNLRSHAEIVQLYEMYNMLLGRIFLTMSLIGDITQRVQGFKDNQGIATAIPLVLVDQNYAIFTYDVLMNLRTLLSTGDIVMDINTASSRGSFSTLHTRKLQAIFPKKDDVKPKLSYTGLLQDAEVIKYINILNKSAFQTKGDDPTNLLRINSAIDMAGTIERLGRSGIYAGAARFQ